MIRSVSRRIILDILGTFSKPVNGIHILNGHNISREDSHIDIFLNQLDGLKKFATFIRIEDAIDLITRKKYVNEVLFAFTFDDGFEECSSMIAPALEQYGVNGLFFINPNFIDGNADYIRNFTENVVLNPNKLPMSWEQILKMSNNGHIIGSHTMDHYMINSNSNNEIEYQIVESKRVIEERIKKPCDHFAFPYGRIEDANLNSINIASRHYQYLFSQSDYKKYFSFNGLVINRRHFEPNWPISHIKYFTSHKKSF